MLIIKAAFYSIFYIQIPECMAQCIVDKTIKGSYMAKHYQQGDLEWKVFLHRAEAQLSDYGKTLISNFMAKIAIFPESGE